MKSAPLFLGEFKVPLVGGVTLKLQMGMFSNVVMPETVESMWGPVPLGRLPPGAVNHRSEEHTSELQSPVPISYAVFCLKKKKKN